jgi:hypothetical protein
LLVSFTQIFVAQKALPQRLMMTRALPSLRIHMPLGSGEAAAAKTGPNVASDKRLAASKAYRIIINRSEIPK